MLFSSLTRKDGTELSRLIGWFVTNSCSCPYDYEHQPVLAQNMPSWMELLMNEVHALVSPDGPLFNSANINKYEDHNSYCGMHSDNEKLFDAVKSDACIASLSVGASRKFTVLQKANNLTTSIMLNDGDVITMERLFQKEFTHGALSQRAPAGVRYNITFRTIVKHCPVCKFSTQSHAYDAANPVQPQI